MKKTLHVANLETMLFAFRFHLMLKLQALGYEVHIAAKASKPEVVKKLVDAGFIFHNIDINRGVNPLSAFRAIRSLKKVIKKEKFDIVHTNTPSGGLVGRLAAHYAKTNKIYHTTAGFYFHENMSPLKYKFFAAIERFLAKRTDVLFSPNREDMATCERINIQPKSQIVYCGPSGVEMSRYPIAEKFNYRKELCERLGISEDTFIIGSIGRLKWEKGFIELVEVVKLLNAEKLDIYVVCAGRGADADEIIGHAKAEGCDNINFVGYTNEVPKYLMAFNMLLFPSYREGFPITTIESMAAQTPSVVFDIRGCRESIVESETGYVVPFKDVSGMVEKTKMLYHNPDVCVKMGVKGRERVLANFTKEHHIDNQLPFY